MHLDKNIAHPSGRGRSAQLVQARAGDLITVYFGYLETVRTDPQVLANNPAAAAGVERRVSRGDITFLTRWPRRDIMDSPNGAAKMTTANTNAAAYVTCPKCYGVKRFGTFAHIQNGDCFRCAGNGTVLRSSVHATAPSKGPAHKSINLPSFGPASVIRFGAVFKLDYGNQTEDGFVGGQVVFDIVGGLVVNAEVSDAARRRGDSAALIREIQAAVKV